MATGSHACEGPLSSTRAQFRPWPTVVLNLKDMFSRKHVKQILKINLQSLAKDHAKQQIRRNEQWHPAVIPAVPRAECLSLEPAFTTTRSSDRISKSSSTFTSNQLSICHRHQNILPKIEVQFTMRHSEVMEMKSTSESGACCPHLASPVSTAPISSRPGNSTAESELGSESRQQTR